MVVKYEVPTADGRWIQKEDYIKDISDYYIKYKELTDKMTRGEIRLTDKEFFNGYKEGNRE